MQQEENEDIEEEGAMFLVKADTVHITNLALQEGLSIALTHLMK